MRSIGEKHIKFVERLTHAEVRQATGNLDPKGYNGVEKKVMDRIPEEVFDIWEGAYIEIQQIILHILTDYVYGRIHTE